MTRFLLFFAMFQFAHGYCPDGFEIVRNGECRGLYKTLDVIDNVAAEAAIAGCKEINAQPVSVHNSVDESYWFSRSSSGRTILGLVCNTTSKAWQWADGSALDYKPTSSLNGDCQAGCVWFISGTTWTKWCDADKEPFNLYCIIQEHPPKTDGCQKFENDSEDGVCYMIGETAENWQDAQMNCKKLGANLASIHNINENSFVRRMAVSTHALEGLFIGGTVSGKSGNFGWIDGSDWDYDNYYPGFPRAGFGDCLVMDTSITTGQWKNIECSAQLPVACIRPQGLGFDYNVTCSADTHLEGEVVTSPGFPFNASMPCEYYLKVDVGKKVEVEIFLEANSCCDFLTIYDGYVGDVVLGRITGAHRNTTFTTTSANIMRVLWQPDGGVNVKGMAMTFRGV